MTEEYKPKQYLPTIDAILSVADLEKITVKKIRNALQELFGINLNPHKQDINEIILERYYDMIDKRKNNVEPELTKEELERQDALMAARLSKSNLKGPVTRGGNKKPSTRKKVQKEGKKKRKPTTNNPFNQEMYLSQEVQNLLGVDSLSRPKLVKQIWAYIKDNNLQNPQDGRQIICDDKLYKVFKKSIFEMNKLISSHLYKKDEMSDGKGGKKPAVKTEMDEVESKADDDDDDAESDGVSDFD